jgi:hypothetical protein
MMCVAYSQVKIPFWAQFSFQFVDAKPLFDPMYAALAESDMGSRSR